MSSATSPIAYYFGAFDPIHEGHLQVAQAAREQFGFSRIEFVPAFCPPNKLPELHSHSLPANFEIRMHQLQKALLDKDMLYCSVNTIEATLATPTFTIETLRALFPNLDAHQQDIPFLMGADSFELLHTWKDPEILCEHLWFIVAPRLGHSSDIKPLTASMRMNMLQMPPVDVSSTDLRAFLS